MTDQEMSVYVAELNAQISAVLKRLSVLVKSACIDKTAVDVQECINEYSNLADVHVERSSLDALYEMLNEARNERLLNTRECRDFYLDFTKLVVEHSFSRPLTKQ